MIIYEEIFREFQKNQIKYVIVGGIALNLLGSLRSTADMDILVEMSDDNLKKALAILKKHGYRVKSHIDPMGILDPKTRQEWIKKKHMKALNFYKDGMLKEVDVVIGSPVTFEKAEKTAVKIKTGNITLPVISIDNLIKMKKSAGRAVDKLDIEELKKIKAFRRKL